MTDKILRDETSQPNTQTWNTEIYLRGCVADVDPGSRVQRDGEKSGSDQSGMNNPDHISESLETIFWAKILQFYDANTGCKKFGSGIEKIRIRDKQQGSATLLRSENFSSETQASYDFFAQNFRIAALNSPSYRRTCRSLPRRQKAGRSPVPLAGRSPYGPFAHRLQASAGLLQTKYVRNKCCGSGSGIRCLFNSWIQGAFLTPGSGIGKISGSRSGMNNPDHIFEVLGNIFWG
jgi:hypothetical protein